MTIFDTPERQKVYRDIIKKLRLIDDAFFNSCFDGDIACMELLLRIILDGIHSPATGDLGYMPGFRHSLDDRQVAALANYLRERFAGKPAWPDLAAKAASLRQQAAP